MSTYKTTHKGLLWRLLRQNISVLQIAGYTAANLIGMAIVLGAVQFYADVSAVTQSDDSFVTRDYMIISKPVTTFNTLGLSRSEASFSKRDIERIESQPWVRKVGQFTAADFSVSASVSFEGRGGMSTHLFLESVPDDFLDVVPEGWGWTEDTEKVPVIISRDYLTLYNFGFAPTHGLPQLSESVMGAVPLMLTLSGNGRRDYVPARIVGFSSRFNTIAVPQAFMDHANALYGTGEAEAPSRLIVEMSEPGSPEARKFIERRGYEVAGDKADNSKAAYFLRLVTGIVVGVGIVITLLALFILTLSITLLLQRNRENLHNLMQLGYMPGRVSRPYTLLVAAVNAAVLCGAMCVTFAAAAWWRPILADLGIAPGGVWTMTATGVVIFALTTSANLLTVRRTVRRAFRL